MYKSITLLPLCLTYEIILRLIRHTYFLEHIQQSDFVLDHIIRIQIERQIL